jgi:hypothetical protein
MEAKRNFKQQKCWMKAKVTSRQIIYYSLEIRMNITDGPERHTFVRSAFCSLFSFSNKNAPMNFAVKCFLLGRQRVGILAWRPVTMTESFRDFVHSLRVNTKIVPQICPQPLPPTFFQFIIHLLTHHSTVYNLSY